MTTIEFEGLEIGDARPLDVPSWDRAAYQRAVVDTLRRILTTQVGDRLVTLIRLRNPLKISIAPQMHYVPGPAETRSVRPPDGHRAGTPTPTPHPGTGIPCSARIEFTPALFRPFGRDADVELHAGDYRDSVLVHELAHGFRCLSGQLDGTPLTGQFANFHLVEEFWATTIENMYQSERGRPLTGNHVAGYVRDELMWPWWESSSTPEIDRERELVRELMEQMSPIIRVFSDIPDSVCRYNPFRDIDDPPYRLPTIRDVVRR